MTFLKGLLHKNTLSRLTNFKIIKENPFFREFNWEDHILLKENNSTIKEYIDKINNKFLYDENDFILLEKYMS